MGRGRWRHHPSEAGGVMLGPDGKRFTYNRENVYNVDGYTLANCLENVLL